MCKPEFRTAYDYKEELKIWEDALKEEVIKERPRTFPKVLVKTNTLGK